MSAAFRLEKLMFSDIRSEDLHNAVLRRRYVFETVCENGGILPDSPCIKYPRDVPYSPSKTRQELDDLHQTYMASRSMCVKMERAVELIEELCALDKGQLGGVLQCDLLEGKILVPLMHLFMVLNLV